MNNLLDELAPPLTPAVTSTLISQTQSGTTMLWSVGCLVPDELNSLVRYRALSDCNDTEGIPTVLTDLLSFIDVRFDMGAATAQAFLRECFTCSRSNC